MIKSQMKCFGCKKKYTPRLGDDECPHCDNGGIQGTRHLIYRYTKGIKNNFIRKYLKRIDFIMINTGCTRTLRKKARKMVLEDLKASLFGICGQIPKFETDAFFEDMFLLSKDD